LRVLRVGAVEQERACDLASDVGLGPEPQAYAGLRLNGGRDRKESRGPEHRLVGLGREADVGDEELALADVLEREIAEGGDADADLAEVALGRVHRQRRSAEVEAAALQLDEHLLLWIEVGGV